MLVPPILDYQSGREFLAPAAAPPSWTALIPAAGRGSRLGFAKPKILFEIAGKTILERLVALLAPVCGSFVFVLSPDGAPEVQPVLAGLLPDRHHIAIQENPAGMADAVASGLRYVETRNVLVIWGDQVAVRPSSIDFCIRVHQGPLQPEAICPTLLRTNPYVHFERGNDGRLRSVLQAREGDRMPETGESDSGVFLFRTQALRRRLGQLLASGQAIGARTGELNFLPILPLIDETPGALVSLRVMTEAESVGVNSKADAEYLERTAFPDDR